jgi:hypothetical protein
MNIYLCIFMFITTYMTIHHGYPSTTYNQIKDVNYKNHINDVPYIRVMLTQPTNQHIPYLSTRPTIPRMPQFTTS